MKRETRRKTRTAAGPTEHALRRVLDDRLAAVRALNELRAPVWEALLAELDRGGAKKSFSRRATAVGRKMQQALEQFRTGKLSRARAIHSYQRALSELREAYEARSIDVSWKSAKLQPSVAEMLMAWYGRSARDLRHEITIDRYLGWLLKHSHDFPSDAGTVQQGLGDPAPPPLGICGGPPFGFHSDRVESQGLSFDNTATGTPSTGGFQVDVFGDLAGGASAHALVGRDFIIPAGFTTISATASIDWKYDGWGFAIGGAAATGAALALRIENPAGTSVAETGASLFSLISPVIWGSSVQGSGSSDIQAAIATPDAKATTIRVFAGVSAHAEAGATIGAASQTIASGTVTKICISAT